MVRGSRSGREYSEKDIFDPAAYPRMKEEPLIDSDDCIVIPVRNQGSPHFRRVGLPSFGARLGRSENDPTHNACVDQLFEKLSDEGIEGIDFYTYVFSDAGEREDQVIFSTQPDAAYKWFKETDSKIGFADGTYIQPDLGGRDSDRFFQKSAYPTVLIEVVRTHHPDEKTFFKLLELSKMNCHTFFYFIGEGKTFSVLNNFKTAGGRLRIRFSKYLLGGVLYNNGKAFHSKKSDETDGHWYQYVQNTYFRTAKEKA